MAKETPTQSKDAGQTPEEGEEKKKINRREFLNLAWLASLGFMTLSLGGVTYLFVMPRFKEGEFGGTFDVGAPSELPETTAGPGNFPKGKFWLSNTEAGILALYKVCTHLGCLYGWSEQEFRFICPCHGSQFEKEGVFIQGPAPRSLDRFIVRAVDAQTGEILAETPEDGGPMPIPANGENVRILVDTGIRIKGIPK